MRILSIGAAAWLALLAGAGEAQAFRSYFINEEVRSDDITLFPKWMDVLRRYEESSRRLDEACDDSRYSPCRLGGWRDAMQKLQGKSLMEQVDGVNRFVNAYPYIEDIINWGLEDYWETPYEFQLQNGDCEDYAISKYMSLRALGVPEEKMRIEIVQDLNLGGIIHAVLIVFVGEEVYVLDNQIKQTMRAVDIYHYKPIYSINETHWWRHIVPQ